MWTHELDASPLRVMSYLTTADYDISCCFQHISDLKVTQFGEKRENVPFMMVSQLNRVMVFLHLSTMGKNEVAFVLVLHAQLDPCSLFSPFSLVPMVH